MRKHLLFLVAAGIIATFIFLYTPQTNRSNEPCIVNPLAKGTIIILNGVSSVGKSSIQKELQDMMEEPYLTFGIDKFLIGTLPEKHFTGEFLQKQAPEEGVVGLHGYFYENEDGKQCKLQFGSAGQNLIRGFHKSLRAMADERNNLIVDYILYDQEWLPDLVDKLYGYPVYFVGVKAPLDIVEKREHKRGTSPEGHARAYHDIVHKHGVYDIVVDTAEFNPQEAARIIQKFIKEHPQSKAFKKLYKRFF